MGMETMLPFPKIESYLMRQNYTNINHNRTNWLNPISLVDQLMRVNHGND